MTTASGRLRTVGLLARRPGLEVLERSLLVNEKVELVAVATHRLLPRSEDPERGERPEFDLFEAVCGRHGVPLYAIDDAQSGRELSFFDAVSPVDLICSVSWRYVLSAGGLDRARVGAVNLHRGKLPDYAGAEPVRRMIEDGADQAVVTAHCMVETVDAGMILAVATLPIVRDKRVSAAELAEAVKEQLVPLYPGLMDDAIEALLA